MVTLSPRRLSAVYLGVIFVVLFTILQPGTFLTSTTMTVVFNSGVVTCLLALAFLVPLTTESYDLSIGALMSFALTVCVRLHIDTGLPLIVIAVLTVLVSALVGVVNGFITVRLHVNSFIATLGTSQLLLAGTLIVSGNNQLLGAFPDSWSNLGQGTIAGIPYPLLYLLALALLMWYVLEFTRIGRYLFATGGNEEAARLSGVRTSRMVWGSMIASGAIAGLAGIVYSMQVGVATSTIGSGLLFPAVTAVFLGAAQLSQRPNVWGTLIAYFALAFGVQGLTLTLGSSSAWGAPLFEGVALIAAVSVASRPTIKKILSAGRSEDSLQNAAGNPATAKTEADSDRGPKTHVGDPND